MAKIDARRVGAVLADPPAAIRVALLHGDDSGLVREDRTILYPVRDDIPIMLVDESIPLDSSDFRSS